MTGARNFLKPVSLETHYLLAWIGYPAVIRNLTKEQWRKFTFADRLQVVISGMFALIQVQELIRKKNLDAQPQLQELEESFSALLAQVSGGFVEWIDRSKADSLLRTAANTEGEDGQVYLVRQPEEGWEVDLLESDPVPSARNSEAPGSSSGGGGDVPKSSERLQTVQEDEENPFVAPANSTEAAGGTAMDVDYADLDAALAARRT